MSPGGEVDVGSVVAISEERRDIDRVVHWISSFVL